MLRTGCRRGQCLLSKRFWQKGQWLVVLVQQKGAGSCQWRQWIEEVIFVLRLVAGGASGNLQLVVVRCPNLQTSFRKNKPKTGCINSDTGQPVSEDDCRWGQSGRFEWLCRWDRMVWMWVQCQDKLVDCWGYYINIDGARVPNPFL